jgi:hypothetical protein
MCANHPPADAEGAQAVQNLKHERRMQTDAHRSLEETIYIAGIVPVTREARMRPAPVLIYHLFSITPGRGAVQCGMAR